jgi:alpha-tubulin suppressor-like RCC1 family protein
MSSVPITVPNVSNAVAAAAGAKDTCVLLSTGSIQCWGDNEYGQLGNGSSTISYVPVLVSGISNAIGIASSGDRYCALLNTGSIQCWGYTDSQNDNTPVNVFSNSKTIALSCSCALLSTGSIHCRGDEYNAQLATHPFDVSSISNAIAVTDACAVLNTGSVQCWGYNTYGGLGNGTTTDSAVPVRVTGISNAIAIAIGSQYRCALLSTGSIRCWGNDGARGQVPVDVSDISTAVAVAAGDEHGCALLRDGSVQCWGDNGLGQFGIGTVSYAPITAPSAVSGISTAIAVSASYNHTCAVLRDGSVQCWGGNDYSKLGIGIPVYSAVPVTVNGF